MPELPEVETTRRGVEPYLRGHRLEHFSIRNPSLRWPVELPSELRGDTVVSVRRRAKYLLLDFSHGSLIVHLGMSGSLRLVDDDAAYLTHDHVEWRMSSGKTMRLNDPRRFGCVLYQPGEAEKHPLLAHLGVEPLGNAFNGAHLKAHARKRRVPIKNLLMDGKVVVGVGNIYANEALFLAGVRPSVQAKRVPLWLYETVAREVRGVLDRAIRRGGTTLRDFVNAEGQPGYFAQELFVYGHAGEPCKRCGETIKSIVLSGRSTFYCPKCQRSQGFRGYT